MESMAQPSLWAQEGGMMGLVIFALFIVLGIFLKAQSRIYSMHRADLKQIMEMHSKERESWGRITDARQIETTAAIHGMTEALNRIASRYRETDQQQRTL